MENKVALLVANNAKTPQQQPVGYLTGGGSGGGDIGLEIRVTRLEDDVKGIRDTLVRLEPLLVRIDERQNHFATTSDIAKLPTRWELALILISFLAVTQIPSILGAIKDFRSPQAVNGNTNEPQGSKSQR